jgi:hypothetical protein
MALLLTLIHLRHKSFRDFLCSSYFTLIVKGALSFLSYNTVPMVAIGSASAATLVALLNHICTGVPVPRSTGVTFNLSVSDVALHVT